MPWVSQYLVMKRVSIEPNFHSLYSNFLDTLKNPEFNKMVLNETYRNIKVSVVFLFINVLSLEILDCTSVIGGGGVLLFSPVCVYVKVFMKVALGFVSNIELNFLEEFSLTDTFCALFTLKVTNLVNLFSSFYAWF